LKSCANKGNLRRSIKVPRRKTNVLLLRLLRLLRCILAADSAFAPPVNAGVAARFLSGSTASAAVFSESADRFFRTLRFPGEGNGFGDRRFAVEPAFECDCAFFDADVNVPHLVFDFGIGFKLLFYRLNDFRVGLFWNKRFAPASRPPTKTIRRTPSLSSFGQLIFSYSIFLLFSDWTK